MDTDKLIVIPKISFTSGDLYPFTTDDFEAARDDRATEEITALTSDQNDLHLLSTKLKVGSMDAEEERKKTLERWDDGDNKKYETQSSVIEPAKSPPTQLAGDDDFEVKEFVPKSDNDPLLNSLRELFVQSFYQFYRYIEPKLKLKSNKTITGFLNETFDSMQQEMLTNICRCFILCSNDPKQSLIGFLTLKEESQDSIYVAQFVIDATRKRQGYGSRLLRHLPVVFPKCKIYWGLCRRVNTPAINFYLKEGAKFIDDDSLATKYDYDPTLYTGFYFTNIIKNPESSEYPSPMPQSTPSTTIKTSKPTESLGLQSQNNMSMKNNSLLGCRKLKCNCTMKCCVIS